MLRALEAIDKTHKKPGRKTGEDMLCQGLITDNWHLTQNGIELLDELSYKWRKPKNYKSSFDEHYNALSAR